MKALYIQRNGFRQEEVGFTLPELMIVIAIMGILAAIAIPSWFGIVNSRRVDSATNQFAADLRLAHTKSTNQLKDYAVVTNPSVVGLTGTGGDYYVVEIRSPITSSIITPRKLDESARTEIDVPFGAKFKPDGSAETVGTPAFATTTTISLKDGGLSNPPKHSVNVVTATSRVKID